MAQFDWELLDGYVCERFDEFDWLRSSFTEIGAEIQQKTQKLAMFCAHYRRPHARARVFFFRKISPGLFGHPGVQILAP